MLNTVAKINFSDSALKKLSLKGMCGAVVEPLQMQVLEPFFSKVQGLQHIIIDGL